MTVRELLEQLGDVLRSDDTDQALTILADVKAAIEERERHTEEVEAQVKSLLDQVHELRRATAWRWLRNNRPASYDQLVRKLELAREPLNYNGRLELGQLIDVFGECESLGVPLEELDTPTHLGKYREAVAYLHKLEGDELKQALKEVRGHENRDETRERFRRRY